MLVRSIIFSYSTRKPHLQDLQSTIIIITRTIPARKVPITPWRKVFEEGKYEELAEYIAIEEIQIKKKNYGVLILKIAKNSFLKEIYNILTHNDWLNLTETIFDFIQKLRSETQVFLNLNPWSIAKNG